MKAKASPLKLEVFELLKSQYKFIAPESGVVENLHALFAAYKIDIDFDHQAGKHGKITRLEAGTGAGNNYGWSCYWGGQEVNPEICDPDPWAWVSPWTFS
ncbi:MAG: hypothetical protein LC670_12975, partial [Flavobacteriales bacterium]|nr:hypothetical protein [Flavobacteriales bacterium]